MFAYIYRFLFTSLITCLSFMVNAEQHRLGNQVSPKEQYVSLKLDPSKEDFSGSTKILLEIKKKTSVIRFHALGISITNAKLESKQGTLSLQLHAMEQAIQEARSKTVLKPGKYTLEMDFTARYNTKSVGLYKTIDQGIPYLFTQFEMSDARRAFPVFDEPAFKIPFQLSISAPETQNVYNNTPELERVKDNGWITYKFAKTPPIPSYLVAMAVGPFEKIPVDGMSVDGLILTPKGKIDQAHYAARISPQILKALEEYFAIPYPYQKLDQVALPEFPFGAMENAGLVTYREDILLLDEKRAQIRNKTRTTMVIAHELAHQWYGNLVTMKWWNDLWLNEAFASWMASKITQQLYPELEYNLVLPQNQVMTSDARLSTKPIRKPIKTEADIMDGLGLAYSKGSAVLTMVEQWIGEEAFKKGIRQYMQDFKWRNAEAADLWDSLGKASGKDVKSVLKSFTEQSGYPLLSLQLEGKKLTIQQRRFSNANVQAPAQLWSLPVSIRYGKGNKQASTSLLLNSLSTELTLKFKPDWILPDDNGSGYYRWQLSKTGLDKLLNHTNKLNDREKLAVLNNVDALLKAGTLTAGDVMASAGKFIADTHPLVVKEALDLLELMKKPFIRQQNQKQWQNFIIKTVTPAADRFGLTPKQNEAAHVTSLRPDILNLLGKDGQDKAIIKTALAQTEVYFKTPEKVPASLVEAYLSIAAHYGDEDLLNQVKTALSKSSDPQRKTKLLNTLGRFGQASVQRKAMDIILDDSITASDVRYLLSLNGVGHKRRSELQKWILSNYEALSEKAPPFIVPSIPLFLSSACEKEQLAALNSFFSKSGNKVEGTERSLAKVSESVNDCISLRQRELNSVNNYLMTF